MKHLTHWIGGKPWDGAADRHGDIYDPATGEVTGRVDFASTAVVGDAVAAAAKAFPGWRATSITRRTQIMFAFRNLVRDHQQELAELISSEHGKVAADAAASPGECVHRILRSARRAGSGGARRPALLPQTASSALRPALTS